MLQRLVTILLHVDHQPMQQQQKNAAYFKSVEIDTLRTHSFNILLQF